MKYNEAAIHLKSAALDSLNKLFLEKAEEIATDEIVTKENMGKAILLVLTGYTELDLERILDF